MRKVWLENIREILQELIANESKLSLEEMELFGESKLAVTISTPHLMGSIEVLGDLTTDLLVVEFDSEDILFSKTFSQVENVGELKEILSRYLNDFQNMERRFSAN